MKSLIRYIPVLLFFFPAAARATHPAKRRSRLPTVAASRKTGFLSGYDLLEGQIYDIKQKGVNPVRTIKQAGGQSDSTWLPVETLNTAFSEFP